MQANALSESSVPSDIGENGFLILSPLELILENIRLNKIKDAVDKFIH
jgi:hypothetical protein